MNFESLVGHINLVQDVLQAQATTQFGCFQPPNYKYLKIK